MNINVLQTRNPYTNNSIAARNNTKNLTKTNNSFSNEIANVSKSNAKKSQKIESKTNEINENVISKSEIQYFQKLFPANSTQIENHIVFNRNGKITETNLNIGSLIDRKI